MEEAQSEITMRHYHQTLDMVTEQIAIIDTKYRYLFANKAYLYAHNRTYDEIDGERLENIVGADAFYDIIKPQLDACYQGEEITYTGWIKFKKLKFKYVKVTYKAIYDEENRVQAIGLYIKDLTKQQQLELSLNESKQIIAQINTTDWLTDLYNKNYFNDYFPKMIKISQRNEQLLAFALLDVDYFKEFTEEHGQNAGERALKKIATSLKNTLRRPNDHIFRLERDEFSILFNVKKGDDALLVAENVLREIRSLQIENPIHTDASCMTVSIGLMLLNPQDSHTVEDLYKKASSLLDKAKTGGKNQICYN